jgi:hypothetical protein
MKKIKPLLFICCGLMAIATLYGAIDLAKSDTSGELAGLYSEIPDDTIIPDEPKEEVSPLKKEDEIKDAEREVRKSENFKKGNINNQKKNKLSREQSRAEINEKIEWESFSRKPINMKFKKETFATPDSTQQ